MQELRDPDIFETMRRLFLALVVAAPLAAQAQAWPAKPIRWVVPYTGGGITDVVTRVVTQKMQTSLGQPIVVDNRPGANSILGADIVAQTAGIDMVHVPYKGTAPALTALMANDIQVLVDVPSTLMPQVRGGKIRSLAMFCAKRIQGAPEVPTIAEAGGPPIESSTWVLFLAPAGTPREIVNRLAAETAKAINEPLIKDRFAQIGIEPVGGSPEQAAQFLDAEIAKWAKVINTAGVKAD